MGANAPVHFGFFEIPDDLPPITGAAPDVSPNDETVPPVYALITADVAATGAPNSVPAPIELVAELALCSVNDVHTGTVVGRPNVDHDGSYPPNRITFRTPGCNVTGD